MTEKTFQLGRFKVPLRFKPLYDRVQTGKSRTAAVKLKCLDCACWQPGEVEKCVAKECPLWLYRPYGVTKSSRRATAVQTPGKNRGVFKKRTPDGPVGGVAAQNGQ
jgi:hypothetical protein